MLMILIAGPYRGGTNDDPELIEANVKNMLKEVLPIYELGHLPVLGEWFALPLVKEAGSQKTGDAIFNSIFHPVSERLLAKCDAVLRIGGASSGADDMVRIAQQMGKPVYYNRADIAAAK